VKPILFESLLDNLFQLEEGVASARKKYVDEEGGDGKITPDEFKRFVEADPSPTKKYVEWMTKQIVLFDYPFDYTKSVVSKFDVAVKKRLIQKTDINQYHTLADVLQTLEEIEGKQTKSEIRKFEKGKGAEKVYEDENVFFVSPTTHAASCYYGKGTKWCTTETSSEAFDKYKKEGVKLYYIIDKKENEKFAVAVYPSGHKEVYDEEDYEVSWFFFSDDYFSKRFGLKEELFKPDISLLINSLSKQFERFYVAFLRDYGVTQDFLEKVDIFAKTEIGEPSYYISSSSKPFPSSINEYIKNKDMEKVAVSRNEEKDVSMSARSIEKKHLLITFVENATDQAYRIKFLVVGRPKKFVEKLLSQEN